MAIICFLKSFADPSCGNSLRPVRSTARYIQDRLKQNPVHVPAARHDQGAAVLEACPSPQSGFAVFVDSLASRPQGHPEKILPGGLFFPFNDRSGSIRSTLTERRLRPIMLQHFPQLFDHIVPFGEVARAARVRWSENADAYVLTTTMPITACDKSEVE